MPNPHYGATITEPLGQPSVAREIAVGSASANTALTVSCRRISMRARGADVRYSVGSAAQTATATGHFIGNGERLDISVPEGANIAVLRDGAVDGVLSVTELI
jgi:hypothetical protein